MFKSIPLAFAAALFLGTAANAAISTADLNMRSGPGNAYPVIGVIPANSQVAIASCEAGTMWCMVNAGGSQGWADANYLAQGGSFVGSTVTYGSTAPFILNYGGRSATAPNGSGHNYDVFPSEDDPNYGTDASHF
jgi:uncharacterized protein YraI